MNHLNWTELNVTTKDSPTVVAGFMFRWFCLSQTLLVFSCRLSPEESSDTVKVASYILIGVGSLSMAMGFFGCIGAIYEIRCLLGLVRNSLLVLAWSCFVNCRRGLTLPDPALSEVTALCAGGNVHLNASA